MLEHSINWMESYTEGGKSNVWPNILSAWCAGWAVGSDLVADSPPIPTPKTMKACGKAQAFG
jgi:hypothetical protein